MRKKNTTITTDAIVRWLNRNPGQHTPSAVAEGVRITTTQASNLLRYLWNRGEVKRQRSDTIRNGPGASTYSI